MKLQGRAVDQVRCTETRRNTWYPGKLVLDVVSRVTGHEEHSTLRFEECWQVLVSDGVTDVLPLEEVSQHVMRHTDAAAACKAGYRVFVEVAVHDQS